MTPILNQNPIQIRIQIRIPNLVSVTLMAFFLKIEWTTHHIIVDSSSRKLARGTFERLSSNRVIAIFIVNGIRKTFSATVSPAMQPFKSLKATLTYGNEDDLTATRSYGGKIGPDTFKLFLDNGLIIEGTLAVPIDPASTVSGIGPWESN